MVKIDLNFLGYNEKFTLDDSITAAFIAGSSVNGYFCDTSDIDVVAVIINSETEKVVDLGERLSIHHVNEGNLDYFDKAKRYCSLRNIPLINSKYVSKVSTKTKRELVIREAKNLQRLSNKKGDCGRVVFKPIDLLSRYFTREWGVVEPWRMNHLKRITSSEESRTILENEYYPIFDCLVESKFLILEKGKYSISPTAVLNDDAHQTSSSFGLFNYHFRNSFGGLSYLKNIINIYRNIKEVNSLEKFLEK